MVAIYKIQNPAGEVYIGQSSNYKRRFKEYGIMMCKDQPRIYNSLCLHGAGNHIFSVVHELPSDSEVEVIDRYEQFYMDLYRDCGVVLLNIREAGLNGKHDISTVKKMSSVIRSDEFCRKVSERNRGNKNWVGKKHKQSTIEKMKLRVGAVREMYGRKGGLHPTAKKIIDTATGKIYGCAEDAAKEIGMPKNSLRKRLTGYWENTTTFKYLTT